MFKARKLWIEEPGKVVFNEIELPAVGANGVRVRTVVSGISHGTEMTAFLGTNPHITRTFTADRVFGERPESDPFFPFPWAGYEAVGVVEEVGSAVKGYAVGDRVWLANPHQSAYVVEDGAEMMKLSDRIADDEAIFISLAGVALNAALDAEIKLGDVVVVYGGGVVGQLTVQMAFLSGARRVFLIEPSEERRAIARRAGAETLDPRETNVATTIYTLLGKTWPDAVIECSGSVAGLRGAVGAAGLAGTVVAAGFYAGGAGELSLGEEFLHNRVTLKASMGVWGCPSRYPERWDRRRTLREVWHLLDGRKLDLGGYVSEWFPFEEAQAAYEAIHAEPGKYFKVGLKY